MKHTIKIRIAGRKSSKPGTNWNFQKKSEMIQTGNKMYAVLAPNKTKLWLTCGILDTKNLAGFRCTADSKVVPNGMEQGWRPSSSDPGHKMTYFNYISIIRETLSVPRYVQTGRETSRRPRDVQTDREMYRQVERHTDRQRRHARRGDRHPRETLRRPRDVQTGS